MKTFYYIIIIAVFLCFHEQNKTDCHVQERTTNKSFRNSGIIKYMFENASFRQIIEIKPISESEIQFRLNIEEKKTSKSTIIRGIAARKISEEPMIDTDDEGEDYYSIQYIYTKGECLFFVRIGQDRKDILKIASFRCYDLPGKSQGLFSLDVLLKRIN